MDNSTCSQLEEPEYKVDDQQTINIQMEHCLNCKLNNLEGYYNTKYNNLNLLKKHSKKKSDPEDKIIPPDYIQHCSDDHGGIVIQVDYTPGLIQQNQLNARVDLQASYYSYRHDWIHLDQYLYYIHKTYPHNLDLWLCVAVKKTRSYIQNNDNLRGLSYLSRLLTEICRAATASQLLIWYLNEKAFLLQKMRRLKQARSIRIQILQAAQILAPSWASMENKHCMIQDMMLGTSCGATEKMKAADLQGRLCEEIEATSQKHNLNHEQKAIQTFVGRNFIDLAHILLYARIRNIIECVDGLASDVVSPTVDSCLHRVNPTNISPSDEKNYLFVRAVLLFIRVQSEPSVSLDTKGAMYYRKAQLWLNWKRAVLENEDRGSKPSGSGSRSNRTRTKGRFVNDAEHNGDSMTETDETILQSPVTLHSEIVDSKENDADYATSHPSETEISPNTGSDTDEAVNPKVSDVEMLYPIKSLTETETSVKTTFPNYDSLGDPSLAIQPELSRSNELETGDEMVDPDISEVEIKTLYPTESGFEATYHSDTAATYDSNPLPQETGMKYLAHESRPPDEYLESDTNTFVKSTFPRFDSLSMEVRGEEWMEDMSSAHTLVKTIPQSSFDQQLLEIGNRSNQTHVKSTIPQETYNELDIEVPTEEYLNVEQSDEATTIPKTITESMSCLQSCVPQSELLNEATHSAEVDNDNARHTSNDCAVTVTEDACGRNCDGVDNMTTEEGQSRRRFPPSASGCENRTDDHNREADTKAVAITQDGSHRCENEESHTNLEQHSLNEFCIEPGEPPLPREAICPSEENSYLLDNSHNHENETLRLEIASTVETNHSLEVNDAIIEVQITNGATMLEFFCQCRENRSDVLHKPYEVNECSDIFNFHGLNLKM